MPNAKKSYAVYSLLFLVSTVIHGQKPETKLEGRVRNVSNDVGAVHVSNLTKNRGTITNEEGFFEISVGLSDTLSFSAVQFKGRKVIITQEVMNTPLLLVIMEDALTELNEVIVMPYKLSGKLEKDMDRLEIGPIITASTEGLPNAFVVSLSQSERKLDAARTWDAYFYGIAMGTKLDPLFNYFSGRTKMLNQRVAREAQAKKIEEVREYYTDSLYVRDLKIPKDRIGDFIYACESDSLFEVTLGTGDRLKIWEVLKKKSIEYLKDNDLFGN